MVNIPRNSTLTAVVQCFEPSGLGGTDGGMEGISIESESSWQTRGQDGLARLSAEISQDFDRM